MTYKNVKQFMESEKVEVDIVPVPFRLDTLLVRLPYHYRCRIKVRGSRESMTGYFSQGSAHTKPPTPEEIVSCVVEDASAGEMDFTEFCSEFGYDEYEDKQAKKVYKACVKQTQDWLRVFSEIPKLEERL